MAPPAAADLRADCDRLTTTQIKHLLCCVDCQTIVGYYCINITFVYEWKQNLVNDCFRIFWRNINPRAQTDRTARLGNGPLPISNHSVPSGTVIGTSCASIAISVTYYKIFSKFQSFRRMPGNFQSNCICLIFAVIILYDWFLSVIIL